MAETPQSPEPVEQGRCECGAFTELCIAGLWICPSCYETRGSCCQEFEPADEDTSAREGETGG